MQDNTQEQEHILVVEDDQGLGQLLQEELSEASFDVHWVASAEQGLEWMIHNTPDLIVCDLKLPGENGMDLLIRTREQLPQPGFVIITAFGSVPQAVEALKAGADDFLTKPLDLDQLVLCVQRTLKNRRLRQEVQRYRDLLTQDDFHGLIGHSQPMLTLAAQIKQLGAAEGPVLIIGESGTGKELVARAVHQESAKRSSPLVVVNCAGIPGELLESELFGHTAGAFTGANKDRKGLFAEANGGSIFLDEISETPLSMQAKLLRVLQDGKIRPVGSNKEMATQARIIAATNKDLEQEIASGHFREDLFYRLETFTLRVPPLREREDDVELLAARFLSQFSAKLNRNIRGFSDQARELLKSYSFPGNVRELQNAVERAVTLSHGQWIIPEDFPQRMREQGSPEQCSGQLPASDTLLRGNRLPTLEELKERYIAHVLEQTQGNKRRAAALLGIGRRTLYRYLGE
ncbi:MAG: sigma-54 dependent transcriptional regulator [Desulfovermiculus sp.]